MPYSIFALLGFIAGATYITAGLYLCSYVGDMRGSRLHGFIGQSVVRGVVVMMLWPLALPIAFIHALRKTKRSKPVLL